MTEHVYYILTGRKVPALRKLARGTVYSMFESLGVGLLKFQPVLAPMKALWALHLRLTIKDPVFILGQGFGVFVYLRNLYFVYQERRSSGVAAT